MKQKIISWCAEYLILVGAFVFCIFLLQQQTSRDMLLKLCTMTITIISLWYLGAFLKYVIRKERPKVGQRNNVERDRYAFPSMHALTISSASAYVGMHSILFGVIMYSIALTIMYARVRTHMHYAVDMFAGFCLGVVLTYISSPIFEKYISLFLYS